nr:Crp/Fnr family transcriptional regulator [uncultured Mediterraneibacter sp.]
MDLTLFERTFPFWEQLTDAQKKEIENNTTKNICEKKTKLHFGGGECAGVQIVGEGRVRFFITSPGGGDITLFRLLDGDVSILSAACMLNGMDIELDMEMETDCVIYTIPKRVYRRLYDECSAVKDYTMEMISEKFSDIMWLLNQFVFSNVASRTAGALLEHRVLEQGDELNITHETLAKDAGTAREVVTRILKQFQADELVRLTRGKITILDADGLARI